MKTLIRSARIQKILESKILDILKKNLKKKILDDLNFKIYLAHHFDFKYIYIKYVTEKINFFALSIYDCGLLKNCSPNHADSNDV